MSKTEGGHLTNVVNFENLISQAVSHGSTYNPSREALTVSFMQAHLKASKSSIETVDIALAAYRIAVAAREVIFVPLSKLATRILNALKATETTQQVDESARTHIRKIQGTRATPKFTEEEKKTLAAEGKEVKEISASQMSYDDRLENFIKLITLLSTIPEYAPNEEDLKIASLITLSHELESKNQAVIAAATELSKARIARNAVLYKNNSGLVDIAIGVKAYVKSVFGASSPQFKQMSKFTFVKFAN